MLSIPDFYLGLIYPLYLMFLNSSFQQLCRSEKFEKNQGNVRSSRKNTCNVINDQTGNVYIYITKSKVFAYS